MADKSKIKFLKTSLLGLAGAVFSFSIFKKARLEKTVKEEKIKMLSEDGQLIEIDVKILNSTPRRLASKEEVQYWIKK